LCGSEEILEMGEVNTRTVGYDSGGGELLFGASAKFANSDYYLRRVCPCVRLSAWNNSAPTGWIFMKFDICLFFEKRSRKCKCNSNRTRI